MKIIEKFDDFFINIINKKSKNKYFDSFMYKITDYGGAIGNTKIALIFLFLGLLLKTRLKLVGFEMLVVLGINQTLIQLIKLLTRRKRPYDARDDINTYDIIMRDYSFPSGHTTASFTLATILYLLMPEYFIFGLIFAIIIAFSRIYLGVHYPSDVLFGIIFGIGSSVLTHYYLMDYFYNLINKII